MGGLAQLLRDAVESGDWSALGERLDGEAILDSSSEAGRLRIEGADAIVRHLSGPGRGEVAVWDPEEWETGVAVTFEWHGDDGPDRRRWYVRANPAGQVVEIWSTAARPSEAAGEPGSEAPAGLLAQLGVSRVNSLSHGGNSGAALLRAEGDGTSFILKRVGGGGSDWLARATRDEGRTAQLYEAGAFERMPDSIGHGIVAVERDSEAAWVAMRDVGSLLLPSNAPLSRDESRRILRAASDIHRAFRGEPPAGAATLEARIGMSSPVIGEAERAEPDLLPKQFEQGWDAFGELVGLDVAAVVLALRGRFLPTGQTRWSTRTAVPTLDPRRSTRRQPRLRRRASGPHRLGPRGCRHAGRGVRLVPRPLRSSYRRRPRRDRGPSPPGSVRAFSAAEHELGMLSGLVQYGWRISFRGADPHRPGRDGVGPEQSSNGGCHGLRDALERQGGRLRAQ